LKAIFAIDAGESTGTAWGIFNPKAPTVKESINNGLNIGSSTIKGDEWAQAQALYDLWTAFKTKCVQTNLMDPQSVELIIEDFILRPGSHAGGKVGIASARIAWMFEGYRLGRADKFTRDKHTSSTIWQPPSAMRHERRLKGTIGWVKGREHERSAFCHIYERLIKILR
jgi:hypothetical protein